jgi:hypothetical protein
MTDGFDNVARPRFGSAPRLVPSPGRRRKPDADTIVQRLVAIKMMVAGMKDAMPTAAAELRREACEAIDDLIGEVRG